MDAAGRTEEKSSQDTASPLAGAAALEHLTGPHRGTLTWLNGFDVDITLEDDRVLHVSPVRPGETREDAIARLYCGEDSYKIEALAGKPIWVNGVPIAMRKLGDCDMIEFGEAGPLTRFCLHCAEEPARTTVAEILGDAVAYLRVSRQPRARRAYRAACQVCRQLARQTTTLFRVGVIVAIAVLAGFVYQQARLNVLLEKRLESSASRLENFAGALARAKDDALTPKDLQALRDELGGRLISNADRLAALERRSSASARVVAEATPSVVFIQGGYGFREASSGRMLRQLVDEAGNPLISPRGQPLLSLEGEGPVAERQFTGTGFAVGTAGVLISNRHVALPWEGDASNAEALAIEGLEPVMIKLIAYMPGSVDVVGLELLHTSDQADLAVLRPKDQSKPLAGLKLAAVPPKAGDEIIVMGYPTGLRSMLAQAGEAFIEELQKSGSTDFWSIAAQLAKGGHIAPLASRGIVGQVTAATVVYDAETTHGGSGGPVLDINGEVVAVNAAILPEFGGSNLGIPVARVRALLAAAGMAANAGR